MSPKAQEEKQKQTKNYIQLKSLSVTKKINRVRRASLWNGGNNAKFPSDTGLMSKVCKGCRELKNMKTAQLKTDERSELAHLKEIQMFKRYIKML